MNQLQQIVDNYIAQWKTLVTRPHPFTFILQALDDLINEAEKVISDNGAQKKAAVLAAIGLLYDAMSPFFPLWLRPFSAPLKNFLLTVVCSSLIDFIVSKYRAGSWSFASSSGLKFTVSSVVAQTNN